LPQKEIEKKKKKEKKRKKRGGKGPSFFSVHPRRKEKRKGGEKGGRGEAILALKRAFSQKGGFAVDKSDRALATGKKREKERREEGRGKGSPIHQIKPAESTLERKE